MAVGIFKPGQGYWTRLMSAMGWGTVVVLGAAWLWDLLRTAKVGNIETVYVQAVAALAFVVVFGLLLYYYLGVNTKVVDFMVATEGEMKKVNWSTRREVLGSTWIVLALTAFTTVFVGLLDFIFARIFLWMGVLEGR